jgi:soluble lytic murein transglycosylase-like protein
MEWHRKGSVRMGRTKGSRCCQAGRLAPIVALCIGAPAAAQGLGCDGLLAGLSEAQRSKYRLVQQACPGDAVRLPASPSPWADEASPSPRALVPAAASKAELNMPLAGAPRATPVAARALLLAPDIDAAAWRHDIDPLLLHAIAHVESRHNPDAVSPVGALGLMQVMPATARRFGVDRPAALRDAKTNLEVSAKYLKFLQRRFGNELPLVLAAYNAGEGAVDRCGRCVPAIAETRAYVTRVLGQYDRLKAAARQATWRTALDTQERAPR